MKKLILIIAVALIGFNSNAQDLSLGAKAGANLAIIGGDQTDDADFRATVHFGGFAEYMITEKFGLQAELLYFGAGATSETSETFLDETFSEDITVRLDYLSLPLLGKYYIAESLSIEAGPQIGFLLSAEEEFEISNPESTESGTNDVADSINDLDFGFALGGSFYLDSGVFFSARYTLGLANILAEVPDSNDFSQQNNVVQFSVGYRF